MRLANVFTIDSTAENVFLQLPSMYGNPAPVSIASQSAIFVRVQAIASVPLTFLHVAFARVTLESAITSAKTQTRRVSTSICGTLPSKIRLKHLIAFMWYLCIAPEKVFS